MSNTVEQLKADFEAFLAEDAKFTAGNGAAAASSGDSARLRSSYSRDERRGSSENRSPECRDYGQHPASEHEGDGRPVTPECEDNR